ncbi:MAG: hypothetical protein KDD66_13610 [Bdellovibrionales bacterium]|nr:hypothetical protein [Bdellovibrionales bacterium]
MSLDQTTQRIEYSLELIRSLRFGDVRHEDEVIRKLYRMKWIKENYEQNGLDPEQSPVYIRLRREVEPRIDWIETRLKSNLNRL